MNYRTQHLSFSPNHDCDVEKTVSAIIDPDSGEELPSIDELSRQYRIASGDDFADYGNLKIIGIGGMGTVFEADDPALERKVAFKILRANVRNRAASVEKFINEARITAKIDHPNIVSVHRLGLLENVGVYFTMKRIQGQNLREIFAKLSHGDHETCRHYTLRRLLEIFIAGCNGVAAAHANGIVHCDLKPGNLMVGTFGEVIVLDWGVARMIVPPGPQQPEAVHPAGTPVEGTPAFIAPELLCGEVKNPDEQTDVYGLGTILYTILTWGKLPYAPGATPRDLTEHIVNGKILPLSGRTPKNQPLRNELAAICYKAMARNRLDRYSSVEKLREDIYNYLDGYPVTACQPDIFTKFFKFIRRHPVIPTMLLAVILSLFGYLGLNYIIYESREKSLYTLIEDNRTSGQMHSSLALKRYKRLNTDIELSASEREALVRNIHIAATNATLEFCQVFDAAIRLSPAGQEKFLISGGIDDFYAMLRMHGALGNTEMVQELLIRCRTHWDKLFFRARRLNPNLDQLINRLEKRVDVEKSGQSAKNGENSKKS